MFDLHGRVALVTGAGQGVGAEIARALACQGAMVAVNDLVADRAEAVVEQIKAAAAEVVVTPFDVTDLPLVREGIALMIASRHSRQ